MDTQEDEELWERADAVLDRLLDLPDERARHAELAAMRLPAELDACVRRLLRAHARPGALDLPVCCATDVPSPELAGRRIGDWVLERELGRGGMSVVWLAHRGDDPQRQRAALKLLTVGALGAHGMPRFRREQAILARLNHPHIAHLYEAGTADDGTSYLAMELVEGERIDRWSDRHELDVRQRVRLMLNVCAAISYAHRNLVVHADLTPSNVMVDEEGHVRVVDFGIGRLLDGHRERTGTAWRALTPDYAAPEQMGSGSITTATDVFGLGALLYRLLAGRAPREHAPSGEITAPSRAALGAVEGPPAVRRARARQLRGDLDTVLLKALAPVAENRYLSVDALSEDLRAWLDSRPVEARRPSIRYRLGCFMARHRVGVAVSAALAATVAIASAQVLAQRDRAAEQAHRAVLVRDFLADVFASTDPSAGSIPSALDLLDEGSRRARDDLLESEPLAAADVLLLTGEARIDLSDYDGAQRDLDAALKTLQAIEPAPVKLLFDTHLQLAILYKQHGPREKAIAHYHEALRWADRSEVPVEDRLACEVSLAGVLTRPSELAAGEAMLRRAISEIESRGLDGTRLYMDALNALSTNLAIAGKPLPDRIALHERRIAAARRVFGEDNGWYAYTLADAVPTYRQLPQELGRAEQIARQAAAISARIYHKPHLVEAVADCNLAVLLQQQGRLRESLGWFERAARIDDAIDRNDLHAESCRRLLAYTRAALGDYPGALEDLARDRRILGKLGLERSSLWLENCALEAAAAWRSGRPAGGDALDACAADHAPAGDKRPPGFTVARAEAALRQGRFAQSLRLLAPVREKYRPRALDRFWMRPWMLSLAAASALGDEAAVARLRPPLQPFAALPPLSSCLAQGGRAMDACLALP